MAGRYGHDNDIGRGTLRRQGHAGAPGRRDGEGIGVAVLQRDLVAGGTQPEADRGPDEPGPDDVHPHAGGRSVRSVSVPRR